jgi:hypothetical protein
LESAHLIISNKESQWMIGSCEDIHSELFSFIHQVLRNSFHVAGVEAIFHWKVFRPPEFTRKIIRVDVSLESEASVNILITN